MIWAIADLHLAISHPNKTMSVFSGWDDYMERLKTNWEATVKPDDLVLIPGDISWALKLKDAVLDLEWIDKLPGTKLISKGNHDLWWTSLSQVKSALPPTMHVIQNDIFKWKGVEIGGTRLWDTPEYSYDPYILFQKNPDTINITPSKVDPAEEERIFNRELVRLETSLKMISPDAKVKIAMVHYPPIGADLLPSRTSLLLEKYKIDICVFGHIHQVKKASVPLGERNGVRYHLTAADYLDFTPLSICPV